jgi:hypothetical protein
MQGKRLAYSAFHQINSLFAKQFRVAPVLTGKAG